MKLNTDNPNHITTESQDVQFAILGGVKLEGLDRLRVTLKIEFSNQAIRHNLDLYNDTQVDKLIRKIAGRFELGYNQLSENFNQLISKLETYRLQEIEKQTPQIQKLELTEEQRTQAIDFLKQPNLLQRTNDLIGKSGVVGEERNRLLMYLIFTSRKLRHPLHVISFGSSGTGKTHLQEKVSQLIPEEDKENLTGLSENALYYVGKQHYKNKLILLEDLDGALNALYPLRELMSKEWISKSIPIKDKNNSTHSVVKLEVEGPVCVAGCTTKESVYEDNANRSFLLYLDESDEQDKKIMDYQRLKAGGEIDDTTELEIQTLFQHIQKVLEPIKIKNPYAKYLELPQEVFKPRRTNAHYLSFISLITFYHQYQRRKYKDKKTGEYYINVHQDDIKAANELIKEVLLRKSDELTGPTRNYFEDLKDYLKQKNKRTYTNVEIRRQFKLPESTQRHYQKELKELGYLKVSKRLKHGLLEHEVLIFNDYEALDTQINQAFDNCINQLQNA